MNHIRATCMEHEVLISRVIDKRCGQELSVHSKHFYRLGMHFFFLCHHINKYITFVCVSVKRIQSLQGLVSYAHWDVPIANIKGETIFRSWKDLFDTNGEMSYQSPRLYSFNGRDVLQDSTW